MSASADTSIKYDKITSVFMCEAKYTADVEIMLP
jgi:hypothetical protein